MIIILYDFLTYELDDTYKQSDRDPVKKQIDTDVYNQ